MTTFGMIVLAGFALAFVLALIHPVGRTVFAAQVGQFVKVAVTLLIIVVVIALWEKVQ